MAVTAVSAPVGVPYPGGWSPKTPPKFPRLCQPIAASDMPHRKSVRGWAHDADRHGGYAAFRLAEVAIPRDLFADILRRIDRLRPKPAPA